MQKRTLPNQEIYETFPKAKTLIRQLIQENEENLEKYEDIKKKVREYMAERVPMFDVDIATNLVMAVYGAEPIHIQANIKRLKTLLLKYEPPKQNGDSVTDAMIQQAREYPIGHLVRVHGKKTICLWHNDKKPSMYIYPDQHGYCFSCQKRADSIDIFMKINEVDFLTAVKTMCKL